MMRIFYNGTDITAACCPEEAIYYDRTGKADSLELTLPFGERWISWGTEEGDTLRVTRDGCDTGEMYITAAELDSGKFRILATAAKPKCRKKGYRVYSGTMLRICARAAGEGDSSFSCWGVEDMALGSAVRSGETPGEFLNRCRGGAEDLQRGVPDGWHPEGAGAGGHTDPAPAGGTAGGAIPAAV